MSLDYWNGDGIVWGPDPTDHSVTVETELITADGSAFPVMVTGTLTDYHNGEGLQEWRVSQVLYKGVDIWPIIRDWHPDSALEPTSEQV